MLSFVVNQNLHNAQKSRKLSVPNRHYFSTEEIFLITILQESEWYQSTVIKAIPSCSLPYRESNIDVQTKCLQTKTDLELQLQLSVGTN